MNTILIKNGKIVNENKVFEADIYIKNGKIELIADNIDKIADKVIIAEGKFIIPGIIDDQVHFREPGQEYKADIASESLAALYGGVTSFMDMPNNNPPILTQEVLENKFDIAKNKSIINYSFYMGTSNDNLDEIMRTDIENVCGVKIFMGSSTGNLLVDDEKTLENIFSKSPALIATHCEDETTIVNNNKYYFENFGDDISTEYHPKIRSEKACYLSSSFAVNLAQKHNTRLHVLHLTTAKEMSLFRNDIPLEQKRITAEVCVHHLYFDESYYAALGNKIKCNPAIKSKNDKDMLWKALLENKLDVIATDHAPHTIEEKNLRYKEAPSGLPLVQHSLNLMLEFYQKDMISMEKIVEKMCHNPAIAFKIKDRGYIREGYWADIAILDPNKTWKITQDNILYKCKWSPLEGHSFKGKIETVLVNGKISLEKGVFTNIKAGKRLSFRS
jgi:dihydroorotase